MKKNGLLIGIRMAMGIIVLLWGLGVNAGLVGRWYFDEETGDTASDSSGSNTGTLTQMDSSSWVTGVSGTALSFDGNDDYVDCGSSNSLSLTDTVTVEAWINPTVWDEKENIISNNLYKIYHRGSSGDKRIYFLFRITKAESAGDSQWSYWGGVVSTTELEAGEWYHVVCIKSGNTMSLYINGVLERKLDCLSGCTVDDSLVTSLRIGKFPYNGIIDEVKIYSNSFTSEDVTSLYLADLLRGQWKMDDGTGSSTSVDSCKYGNTGTLTGMDSSSCWVTGINGGALSFDGTDNYLDCGSNSSLSLTDSVTIETWINPTVWNEKENIIGNNLYRIYHRGYDGDKRIYFLWRIEEADSSGDSQWNNWGGVVSTTELDSGQWYHVVGVKSGDTMSLYINGVLEKELTCLTDYTTDDSQISNLIIGKYPFNGIVDETRIYATGLSSDNVWALFKSYDLRAYWKMDDASGNNAMDFSKNGNTATLTNMDTSSCWVDGVIGKALCFDGTNNYLDCGNDSSLSITSSVSVETWINPTAWDEKENIIGNNLYRIYHRGYDGDKRIYFLWRIAEAANSGDSQWNNWGGVVSTTELDSGQWYHVVGVKSGDTMSLYINGVLEKELTCLTDYTTDDSQITNLILGKYPFNGLIDETRIYSLPLSADEIRQHYCMEKYGYFDNPTGDSVGGGEGYSDVYTTGDYVVFSKAGLLSALESASSGEVIFIDGDTKINLTEESEISIPAGVTLASNRGYNGSDGALIYTDDLVTKSLTLFIMHDNTRFTGIRLKGPDQERRVMARELPVSFGLTITAPFERITIDNNEIFGWAYAGVYVTGEDDDGDKVTVSHNYFHHCQRRGHGYGVSTNSGAESLVKANLFDWCRHAVAGWSEYDESYYTSSKASGYEACYNLVLPHANGISFDMHGGTDVDNINIPAGDKVLIHHNTLLSDRLNVTGIRGIPTTLASVYENWTVQTGDKQDIFGQYIDDPYQNMEVYDNHYGLFPFENSSISGFEYPDFTAPQGVSSYMVLGYGCDNHPFSITVDSSDSVYTTGCYEYGALTAKYDSSGNLDWKVAQTSRFTCTYDVAVDSTGNVYVVGSGYDDSGYFCGLIKYDSSGSVVWYKTYGTDLDSQEFGYGVAVDGSDNVIVTGCAITGSWYHPEGTAFTVKYDSSGNVLWQNEYVTGYYNRGRDVAVDGSGNIYVVGMTQSSDTEDYDVLLIKYLSDGTQSWVQVYDSGSDLSDWGYHLKIGSDDKVYICGQSYNGSDWDFLTMKYESDGTLDWANKYDNGNWEYARGIDVDSSGNVYVTGFADDLEGKDFMTIKYDSSGTLAWSSPLVYDGGNIDQAYGIALDSTESFFYVTGYVVNGALTNIMTIKYTNP